MSIMQERRTRQPSALFVKLAQRQLGELSSNVSGINTVVLATGDGFEVVKVTNQGNLDSGKIAAVSSSILSMVQAFSSEIKMINCQSLILDADNGKAIIAGVPCKQFPMVMVVLTTEQALLGQVLHGIRNCSQHLMANDFMFE